MFPFWAHDRLLILPCTWWSLVTAGMRSSEQRPSCITQWQRGTQVLPAWWPAAQDSRELLMSRALPAHSGHEAKLRRRTGLCKSLRFQGHFWTAAELSLFCLMLWVPLQTSSTQLSHGYALDWHGTLIPVLGYVGIFVITFNLKRQHIRTPQSLCHTVFSVYA